ncbi:MAG: hypothetical protein PF549_01930 [Patescibacteria group bacterium]|jgi:Tfp pilus assembly protein PilN|nr:hypothetical protein [Patescibacteria group bacterium]
MRITINLLPPDKKENLRTQQLTGVALKIGFSALFAGLMFLVFLYSCLFIINITKTTLEKEIAQLQKVEVYSEVQKAYDVVNDYHKNTKQLDEALSDNVSYIEILEKLNNLISEGLFFQEISITEEELIIKGFSSNRD